MDNNELLQMILHELQDLKTTTQAADDKLDDRLSKMDGRLSTIDKRLTKVELTQENEVAKKISLLIEAQKETHQRVRQLDELHDQVDDIQTTVSVLKALTVKK